MITEVHLHHWHVCQIFLSQTLQLIIKAFMEVTSTRRNIPMTLVRKRAISMLLRMECAPPHRSVLKNFNRRLTRFIRNLTRFLQIIVPDHAITWTQPVQNTSLPWQRKAPFPGPCRGDLVVAGNPCRFQRGSWRIRRVVVRILNRILEKSKEEPHYIFRES